MHEAGTARRTVAVLASYSPSLLNFRGPLLRRLVGLGHRVIAMAPSAPGMSTELAGIGLTFEPIDVDRTGMNPRRDLAMQRNVTTVLRKHEVDTFLAYTIKPVVWGIPAARRAGVTTRVALITGIGHALAEMPRWHPVAVTSRILYQRALRDATAVVFQNPDDRHEFVEGRLVAPDRTHLVAGSGVDLAHYRHVPPPASPPVRFLLIARLLATKGIREYVAAARAVLAERSDCEFHLLGPTDPNPSSLTLQDVQSWVDEGIIHYHGSSDDVRPHLEACHVYVLPSYREGTPRSVLEAMATGRPIITTDVAGCRATVIGDRNGMLVAPRDASALADAMMRMADDTAARRRMGAASRQIVESTFDAELVVNQMLDAMEIGR